MHKLITATATFMLLSAPLLLQAQNGKGNKKPAKANEQEMGVATAPAKDISGNDLTQTITCNGEAVTITGNDNTITIQGKCSKITLIGNDNKILIDDIRAIKVTGNDNEVSYKSSPNKEGKARIASAGDDNNIVKED